MILSKGESSDILKKWDKWYAGILENACVDLNLILPFLGRNGNLYRFLTECKKAMQQDDIKRLDQLVLKREIDLKGKTRSKLNNRDDFTYKGWVGISKLQYRLENGEELKEMFINLSPYYRSNSSND